MFSKKTIKKLRDYKDLSGKKVFLRADYNVPIKNGKILDDYKIIASLPTLRYLMRYKCKIIISTHLGEPKEKDKKFTTKPIAGYLSKLLGKKVKFAESAVGVKAKLAVSKMNDGEILLLENLRFEKGETENDKFFAKKLASLADVYINNAFAVCHRAHASVSAIKKYLPSFAGFLVEEEVASLNKVLKPEKPLIVVMGGSKIGTKIKLVEKLSEKAQKILIGGALANNFFAAHKLEIGKSLVDDESIKFASKFKKKNLLLPIDAVVAKKINGQGKLTVKNIMNINKDDVILDIGPKTVGLYASYIKKAKTIIWNGPLGMFENKHFKHGTLALGQIIAARSQGITFGVVGGGETIEALKLTKMMDYVDWVSTGGGAMLSYLGGEKMPGLEGII